MVSHQMILPFNSLKTKNMVGWNAIEEYDLFSSLKRKK